MLLGEIQSILNNCISFNTKALQRRQVDIKQLPKEFGIVELRKQIQNNLDSFGTKIDIKRNIYMPDKVDVIVTGTTELPPIITKKQVEIVEKVAEPTPPPKPPVPPAPSAPSEVAYEYVLSNYHPTDNRTFILRQLGTNGVISYILSPGQERTVCAIENSVSIAEGGYGNISKRSVCGTTPSNTSQITPTTQTKPNLQDTRFSTAEQQAIGLTVTNSGNRSYAQYVPVGLDGTTNNSSLANVENDPTGRDY
jgi:hypothetical protein